jgi:hypothetical protein
LNAVIISPNLLLDFFTLAVVVLAGPKWPHQVTVRFDRYPFQRQGSRSSTLVIL